jgi:WD40 repeat protein
VAWSDLSPDGTTIAVRTATARCVVFFDATTGKEQLPLVRHQSAVNSVAVSPAGRLIAAAADDQRLLLWDLPTGRVLRELYFVPGSYQDVHAAAFSADGKWVAAVFHGGNPPGWVRVWETATGKEVLTIQTKERDWERKEFAFHPQGKTLIAPQKTRLETWSLPAGPATPWEEGHDQPIETVTYHPDGEQVASGDKSGVVCLWDATSRKRLNRFRCEGPILRARFSPDGKTLAVTTAAPDAAVYWCDLRTGTRTRRPGQGGSLQGLAWQPDSRRLATVAEDGTVLLWTRDPDKEPRPLRLRPSKVRHVTFTPDGRHLVTANDDGSIYVLRLHPTPQPPGGHDSWQELLCRRGTRKP